MASETASYADEGHPLPNVRWTRSIATQLQKHGVQVRDAQAWLGGGHNASNLAQGPAVAGSRVQRPPAGMPIEAGASSSRREATPSLR